MASFSRRPRRGSKYSVGKGLIFICLLAGNVHWISYRASLTSHLSVKKVKIPFTNIHEFSRSGYKLINKKGDFATKFLEARPGTIYFEVFQNNIGDDSFKPSTQAGLQTLLDQPRTAYHGLVQDVLHHDHFHCKVENSSSFRFQFLYQDI